ncbi:MAG: bifunctional demethylmenaquinone methyltransferase/2-methoxy-6-polyprenyl-1,4-benzoquinol methylase UbiE [Polyangiales bacterium]
MTTDVPSSESASTTERLGSGAMFDEIAERYDFLNRVLSMGIDHGWRRKTVQALIDSEGTEPKRVLDLATGTADLALAVAKRFPEAKVTGSDPSRNMLAIGEKKVAEAGAQVALEVGDAQRLPYADDSFDACCISFGIRNVPDRDAALREMARVVRPGGRVAILELSEPQKGAMAFFARLWIRQAVPRIGAFLSGSREYRYLQQSIAAFPAPDAFAAQMERAGLRTVATRPLTFGVCCLYVAEVPR